MAAAVAAAAKARKRHEAKVLQGVVKGQPLPQSGTCKHYRQSRRWFRFPCCGLAFPCDECHADAARDKPHELLLATHQVNCMG
jgi:hypothetical protein